MTSDPAEDIHRTLYSGIAEWYVRTFYEDLSDLDWLSLFAREIPPKSIVADIGCGPGQFAKFFRLQGHRVLSIDLAGPMLEQGRLIDSGLVPVVGDIRHIPLRSGTAGGVLAAYTLEHVRREEIHGTLSELSRVLLNDGALALMIKCGEGAYDFRSSLVLGARGFVQLWLLDELSAFVNEAGFETIFMANKPPSSPEEFNHDRGFILARKR